MGLAHELRNPLSSIKGIVQLLKLQDRSKEKDEYLDRIVQEINRLDRFVGELLDFSNQSPTPPVSCRLNEVMRSAAQLIRTLPEALQEKKIELVEAYGEVPESMIEPDRLSRAFANIIRNAYEAAAPGSKVTLKTETRSEGGEKFAVAIVHNTGSTISEEDRRKIFLPFFTTKERGTGLGLAIAHQIITQQHCQLILLVGPSEVSFVAKFKIGQDSGVWAQVPDAHGDDPAVRREVVQV
ncbi:hypothetical protein HYR69_04340 [Candidatus Sumerlaeota bacterium]|nr:hypothetical protein [Candidatus Sumerlaeota bacterium]